MPGIAAVCVLNTTINKFEWRLKSDNTLITDPAILAELNADTCKECAVPFTPEALVKRTCRVGWDNGVTPGSSANDGGLRPNFISFQWEFTVESWIVNGQNVATGKGLGPFPGWTPQLQGWADCFNAINPNAPTATSAFGFNPAPTWRFAEVTDCTPTASYGTLTLLRDDGVTFWVYPVIESLEYTYAFRYATLDCDGNKKIIWCDEDGVEMDKPEDALCYVPVGYVFGPCTEEDAVSPCISDVRTGACDKLEDGTKIPFVQIAHNCNGLVTFENYTYDSYFTAVSQDDYIEYEIAGAVVKCSTDQPIPDPTGSLDQQILDATLQTNVLLEKLCEKMDCFLFGTDDTEPVGDPAVCASRKLGADIKSNNPGEGTHTLGDLVDTNGALTNWSGSFVVTDSAGATHPLSDGGTISGLASGSTQQVTYTGMIHWTDGTNEYRCNVTDKPISANFVVS